MILTNMVDDIGLHLESQRIKKDLGKESMPRDTEMQRMIYREMKMAVSSSCIHMEHH